MDLRYKWNSALFQNGFTLLEKYVLGSCICSNGFYLKRKYMCLFEELENRNILIVALWQQYSVRLIFRSTIFTSQNYFPSQNYIPIWQSRILRYVLYVYVIIYVFCKSAEFNTQFVSALGRKSFLRYALIKLLHYSIIYILCLLNCISGCLVCCLFCSSCGLDVGEFVQVIQEFDNN